MFTLVGALSLVFTPAFVTPVQASTRSGFYIGNGQTTQVNSGLATIRSLRIVSVPERGPASIAYTTNLFGWAGVFLNGDKKDTGIALEAGNFTVCNLDFNENGVIYHWEANSD